MKNQERMTERRDAALSGRRNLGEMLDIVDELIAVMREENGFLRSGMPATLSELGARKDRLTQKLLELGGWPSVPGDAAEQELLRRHVVASGEALKALTTENMQLLESAMSASRRRIESVMKAIRAHEGGGGSGNGRGGAADFRISTVKFEA